MFLKHLSMLYTFLPSILYFFSFGQQRVKLSLVSLNLTIFSAQNLDMTSGALMVPFVSNAVFLNSKVPRGVDKKKVPNSYR